MKFAVIYKHNGIMTHKTFNTAAEAYQFARELEAEGLESKVREVRR